MTTPYGQQAALRRPSGGTAVLAGLLALALAGVLGYLPVRTFIDFGINDLPDKAKIVLGLYLGAALLLLIGALVTFFRALAGGVLLILAALAAIGAVVAEPLLLFPGQFTQFFKAVFQLQLDDSWVRIAGVAGGFVVLVLSVLPATFRYLRYRPADPGYPVQPCPPRAW
ncbi:hypothetical protein FPZ12_011630 [Amycolatopsis acidicola]|uniref:Uncharacterized protein n=1 Tax=Amycolatopsis acidicola TaxID=2596893 RepID=A0A5N0V9T3_9PSEU|nr:hypothetical protein [Amycolatopsis acidicola]KAA9162288.1 hypothetical protein FPZ12_011630 [Amycolatopsis acidicola]